ncbi:MAG: dTDP-glucose 4,6-dehydratase [Saprospiraceae bacterium]|nr:dTDP-glucose 4,6-dehydratase [Saprospiraceae bacterium]MBK9723280.1 dTDP-glucose 4,6-dehydratase [Saprospiraceae bacterium]
MQRFSKHIMITGGAGFIGSHLVRHFVNKYPNYNIVNLDNLTYAGNLENLRDVENSENYTFIKADIVDLSVLKDIFKEQQISHVIHLAAESHVDRSITDPTAFIKTNVLGTLNLLLSAKEFWEDSKIDHRFYHISTDEVFGTLGDTGFFTEQSAYDPRSPYSASKASSDHLVRAFFHTYKLPVVVSNCSNNYGPNQFPEKLIPLIINNILQARALPVYGQGLNVRDWLWVGDHVAAIDIIFHQGILGDTYNIGGNSEMKNIDLVYLLCDLMDVKLGNKPGQSRTLIQYVHDRPGHDLRYAIDSSHLQNSLKWKPEANLTSGLSKTIDWYLSNKDWLQKVSSGEYLHYYEKHYKKL